VANDRIQQLDPHKVQICRVVPHPYDNGQPCGCPTGTCVLWRGGLRPATAVADSGGEVEFQSWLEELRRHAKRAGWCPMHGGGPGRVPGCRGCWERDRAKESGGG
jgi:hypothetical protein